MAVMGNEECFAALSDKDKRLVAYKKTAADYEEIVRSLKKAIRELERKYYG